MSELIGPLGGKLHTGRSRNDQVATDMRLWLLEQVQDIEQSVKRLLHVIVERADKEKEILLPGYTHLQVCSSSRLGIVLMSILQRGQPIRWSHLLLSHATSFRYDLERLQQLIPRISVLPLGSGALAGNPFAVDREFLAKELGFASIAENSMWGVGDRDFIVEFLMWASLTMTHISRMAEDLIIYSTAEFGFVTLSDAYRSVYGSPQVHSNSCILQHWLEHNAAKEKSGFIRTFARQIRPVVWKRKPSFLGFNLGLTVLYRWPVS